MVNVAMLERRLFCARMGLAMLNFSFKFHTVLWAFDKKQFLMLACMCCKRSVRYLCLPVEKTTFELNFSAMEIACYSETCVCVYPLCG